VADPLSRFNHLSTAATGSLTVAKGMMGLFVGGRGVTQLFSAPSSRTRLTPTRWCSICSTLTPACGRLIVVADPWGRLRQRFDDMRDRLARRKAELAESDDQMSTTGSGAGVAESVAGERTGTPPPDVRTERPDAWDEQAESAQEPGEQAATTQPPGAPSGGLSATRAAGPPRTPDRHPVPDAYRAAAAWSWRTLVIAGAIALIGFVLWQVRVVVFAVAVAVLLAALLQPAVTWLRRLHLNRGLAAAVVFVVFIAGVSGVLTLVGDAVGNQFEEVVERAGEGLTELQAWFAGPPFYLTDEQIQTWVDRIVEAIGQDEESLTAGAVAGAAAAVEFLSGLVIALFALLMFLYDGPGIWRWAVRLFPRGARHRVDGAGNQAWMTLTSYIRGQTLIAVFDGFFITILLFILSVPLALALGVLVFFGAYIPLVGAIVAGAAAVLVAFVANGFVTAVIVLIGIIAIQQIEGNVFAPLVLGRMARIHPLAVVLSITLGVLVAGILGGIVAVPLVAMANSVGKYLANPTEG
jgi:predicted PurR-regulated permease PerM